MRLAKVGTHDGHFISVHLTMWVQNVNSSTRTECSFGVCEAFAGNAEQDCEKGFEG